MTHRRLASAVLALVLVCPVAASAAPVSITTWLAGRLLDTGLHVGANGFATTTVPLINVGVEMLTGPILNVAFNTNQTTYALGGGRIDAWFSWLAADGSSQDGTFTAPVLPFDFLVNEDALAGGGLGPTGSADGVLGPGLFSRSLANTLGVKRQTPGGVFRMEVDVNDYLAPGPVDRSIGQNESYVEISTTAVPEPATLGLLALGAVGLVRSQRRRA